MSGHRMHHQYLHMWLGIVIMALRISGEIVTLWRQPSVRLQGLWDMKPTWLREKYLWRVVLRQTMAGVKLLWMGRHMCMIQVGHEEAITGTRLHMDNREPGDIQITKEWIKEVR